MSTTPSADSDERGQGQWKATVATVMLVSMATDSGSPRWLLLVHQLPAKPSKLRVKTWRRLQGVGSVLVKNSVYVLPNSTERREDFEWIRAEIVAQGGEAVVFAADAVDDLADAEVVDAFSAARRGDWEDLRRRALEVHGQKESMAEAADRDRLEREVKTLRSRAAQIDKIDYFRSPGRRKAIDAIETLGRQLSSEADGTAPALTAVADYQGRRWLTRPRPGVDRMASAWLIRRFIDPEAEFLLADRIPPGDDLVPFDMFGVGFGHHGELCTFETLLRRFNLAETALERIGRIVHDLDLKSASVAEPETVTVGRLVEGLREAFDDDQGLLEQGMTLFEALYRSLRSEPT